MGFGFRRVPALESMEKDLADRVLLAWGQVGHDILLVESKPSAAFIADIFKSIHLFGETPFAELTRTIENLNLN